MKVSLHTARAFLRTSRPGVFRQSLGEARIALAIRNCSLLTLRRTFTQSMSCQSVASLEDAPMDCSIVICFSSFGGSTVSFAKRDQTDVGISGTLHPGLGFFGRLHAAPALLPCGLDDHERRGPGRQLFHVLHSTRMDLGPLCTPAVLCSRRATLDGPDLTACRFGSSLNQPRMAHFW